MHIVSLALYLALAPSKEAPVSSFNIVFSLLVQVVVPLFMSQKDCNILSWNVRGLNAAARRVSVRNTVQSSGATIVCLQQTKIAQWTARLVSETLGHDFATNYVTLPADGTRGGILMQRQTSILVYRPRTTLITQCPPPLP